MRALFLALLVVAGPLWAEDWKTTHQGQERGDIFTYAREVDNSPVKAFKGIVEVKASMASVLAVLTGVDNFGEWIFQIKGAERLSADHQERIHMRFKGIWPVSDRDVVLANTLTQESGSGTIILHSVNAEGFPPKQDGVSNWTRIQPSSIGVSTN